jgi:fibronectin-binding autotransporter adhesin
LIQGDVLVHGTLSPGNSPGMLTANANVTMAAGSTFKEDIGGAVQASASSPVGAPGYYAYLHVTGDKQFVIQPGSTLAPALQDLYTVGEAGYGSTPVVPVLGQGYRIITADGGIAGRFDTLAQPAGMNGTRMAAFYNVGGNNSIELKVLPASYATWSKNANANSRATAAALDSIVELDQAGKGSALQTKLLYTAGSYNAQTLGTLVKGLSGEVHGALAAAAPQAGWDMQKTILKHGAPADGRSLWIDVAGNRGKWSGDDAASGFSANRVQVTVGADLLKTPGGRFGVGVNRANTNVSADLGTGTLHQNKVFVYGETGMGRVVLDGLGSYGRDKVASTRSDPFASTSPALAAHTDGSTAMLGFGLRAPLEFRGARVEPFVRVTAQKVERDASSEGTASMAALSLDGYAATTTRTVAGLSGASRNADPLLASTYRFSLGAGTDAGARLSQQGALAGVGASIGGPNVGRGFVQGSIAGTRQLTKGAYVYIGVTGEARSGYSDLGGNAGVRAVF